MTALEVRQFSRYVALGDSISIDLYPELDLAARGTAPSARTIGAASLLRRNDDDLWPEFAGHDLITHNPEIELINLCGDGAATPQVLEVQLPGLPPDDGVPVLITLTVGGNDLLGLAGKSYADGEAELERIVQRFQQIVGELGSRFARPAIILATVYDPSDGAAHLGDGIVMRREWEWLKVYNDAVRRTASERDCSLADTHAHFFGHGLSERDRHARWYWSESIIEPGARGASEMRRLWLACLGIAP